MNHIIVAGLGNPGENYKKTRHNIGFEVIDQIRSDFNFPSFNSKFSSLITSKIIDSVKLTLIKPQTYMNLSGEALSKALHFYKIKSDDLIVIHDDIDLNLSKVKMKIGGGSGGHNGLKSIDQYIGNNYYRVRIGIGKSANKFDISNFVLGHFSKEEHKIIEEVIVKLVKNFNLMIDKNLPLFMNKLNF